MNLYKSYIFGLIKARFVNAIAVQEPMLRPSGCRLVRFCYIRRNLVFVLGYRLTCSTWSRSLLVACDQADTSTRSSNRSLTRSLIRSSKALLIRSTDILERFYNRPYERPYKRPYKRLYNCLYNQLTNRLIKRPYDRL